MINIKIYTNENDKIIRNIFLKTHQPYNINKSVSKFISKVLSTDFKDINLFYNNNNNNILFLSYYNDKIVGYNIIIIIKIDVLQYVKF